jgi:D-amino peptidase
MEGIAGVATRSQVRRGDDDYPAARLAMTREANAAIAGAFDGGAEHVLVSDAHGGMANLLPVDLDRRATLVFGSPKVPWGMMNGIGPEVDTCVFIGYHAAAGSANATMEHTFSSAHFTDFWVDEERWSELHVNAAVAGRFDATVAFLAGDDVICRMAEELLPGIATVATKSAIGRTAVASLHPAHACDLITAGVRDAVADRSGLKPFAPQAPHLLRVALMNSGMAEMCTHLPGTQRVDARTIQITCPDIGTLYNVVVCWAALAAQAPS